MLSLLSLFFAVAAATVAVAVIVVAAAVIVVVTGLVAVVVVFATVVVAVVFIVVDIVSVFVLLSILSHQLSVLFSFPFFIFHGNFISTRIVKIRQSLPFCQFVSNAAFSLKSVISILVHFRIASSWSCQQVNQSLFRGNKKAVLIKVVYNKLNLHTNSQRSTYYLRSLYGLEVCKKSSRYLNF